MLQTEFNLSRAADRVKSINDWYLCVPETSLSIQINKLNIQFEINSEGTIITHFS